MIMFCVFKHIDFEVYYKYLNVIFPVETYKPQGMIVTMWHWVLLMTLTPFFSSSKWRESPGDHRWGSKVLQSGHEESGGRHHWSHGLREDVAPQPSLQPTPSRILHQYWSGRTVASDVSTRVGVRGLCVVFWWSGSEGRAQPWRGKRWSTHWGTVTVLLSQTILLVPTYKNLVPVPRYHAHALSFKRPAMLRRLRTEAKPPFAPLVGDVEWQPR